MNIIARLGIALTAIIEAEEKHITALPGIVVSSILSCWDTPVEINETPESENTQATYDLSDDPGLMSVPSDRPSVIDSLAAFSPFDYQIERIMSLSGDRFGKSTWRTGTPTGHSASSPTPEWFGTLFQDSEESVQASSKTRPLLIAKEFTPRIISIELSE